MNRRHLVSTLGAMTASTWVAQAYAQQAQQTQSEGHEHHHDHSKMVAAAAGQGGPNVALQMSATHCVAKGQLCLAHCLRLLASGDTSMADCAVKVNQMLALCGALANLSAQGATLTPALAKVALEACKQCAEACHQHISHHKECKECHDACQECIKACQAVV